MQVAVRRHTMLIAQRRFGRGPVRVHAAFEPAPKPAFRLGSDARLFASTFAAGFLFVTVFLA